MLVSLLTIREAQALKHLLFFLNDEALVMKDGDQEQALGQRGVKLLKFAEPLLFLHYFYLEEIAALTGFSGEHLR